MAKIKNQPIKNQISFLDCVNEIDTISEDEISNEIQTKSCTKSATKAVSIQSLNIVKALYEDTETTNWEELFDGFDKLYAITFSSGIDFVNRVIDKFEYSEVIFGCENIVGNDIATIMSVQISNVQKLAKSKAANHLAERINEGTLQLYVSRDTKSHEKIFILESEDGSRVRVITGSANMSASAFYGFQRENIICFDDSKAFEHYKELFDNFKTMCSDVITHTCVVKTASDRDYLKDHIEETPVAQTVENAKYIFLEQAEPQEDAEYEFVADVTGMKDEIKPMLPTLPTQSGKIILAKDNLAKFTKRYTDDRIVRKVTYKKLPKLHIDYDAHSLTFNDVPIDLHPNMEAVAADIQCITKYISGIEYFYGDVKQTQNDYFAFMNWYLASPFFPYLRLVASENSYSKDMFPVVGIMYGDSNGGKSSFVRFLTKMMCGTKIPMNTTEDFTATNIDALKRSCEGVPLNFDDLSRAQFTNHRERIIKNEDWGIKERFINYPAISITSNTITSLPSDISKRAIVCRIYAKTDNEQGTRNAKTVNESISNISTAFYGEYAARMLYAVEKMAEHMRRDGDDYYPDIFMVSSRIIQKIFSECHIDIPPYIRTLRYSDYLGDKNIGRIAVEKIKVAWRADPKKFRVNKKENELIYTCPDDRLNYELKCIQNELPRKLNARVVSGNQIVMDYKEAKKIFGIHFRRWPLG